MLNTLQAVLHQGTTDVLVLLVGSIVIAILAIALIGLMLRVRSLTRRLGSLVRGADGLDLEAALADHMRSVDEAISRADALEQAVGILQAKIPACLQRVSVVRYDAFEDVGGEQSFAVALLDAQGDGVLLSSIYTRQDVRIYAKSISAGQASHSLSVEEQKALRQ